MTRSLFASLEPDDDLAETDDTAATRMLARVALPVPVDELFDYAVPDELARELERGCRVRVRFSGRPVVGLVYELRSAPTTGDGRSLALIEEVVDSEPVLSGDTLDWLSEAARALLCPIGVALHTALPAGSAPRVSRELHASARGREALLRGAVHGPLRDALGEVARRPASVEALARRQGVGRAALRTLERDGLIERRRVQRGPSARIATVRWIRIRPGVDVDAACAGPLARAPRQAELLRRIAAEGPTLAADLGASEPLRLLARRELVESFETARSRGTAAPTAREVPPELTEDQARALVPIESAVRERGARRFLLHGVTGSGKTEVYLRAVAASLEIGRPALVLVPEITLTHQIVARLRARFGDALAILHSGLRPGERLEQWQRLRAGETPIAVGARSALFAPLESPGVIVIDEEHDGAYKNEEGLRYHARELAWSLALRVGCPLVLGSATPSLETRAEADRGELRRLVLPRRIAGRPLPGVELVDLVRERERSPRGRKLVFSPTLRSAIEENLNEGGQTLLFLNRRGFSTRILCFECGQAERCKDCDVALVYHASEQRLRCHYCDFSTPPPELCSGCGAPDSALMGVGTERVEEDARALFPTARIARLDRDSARRRGYTEGALRALREGRLDILIGTQMIAKGHDFPGVRLVGVIAADLGLHMPDFRAAERTFQLLTQVAGRAGRDSLPGRVVVQTFMPDHYAVQPVLSHDYEGFYRQELAQRAALGFPPCGHLAQVMLSAVDEALLRDAAEQLAARMTAALAPDGAGQASGVEVLGPAPAPFPRLRGRFRWQLLLKGASREAVRTAARIAWQASQALPRDVRAVVDVTPIHML